MDYDKLIAPAAAAMRPSGIRKFFDLAAEMPECISLGVGEPDFKTPWAVREAGIESLEHGRTRYMRSSSRSRASSATSPSPPCPAVCRSMWPAVRRMSSVSGPTP